MYLYIYNIILILTFLPIIFLTKILYIGIALALDKELDLISMCLPVILKAKAMEKMGLKPSIGKIADELTEEMK